MNILLAVLELAGYKTIVTLKNEILVFKDGTLVTTIPFEN